MNKFYILMAICVLFVFCEKNSGNSVESEQEQKTPNFTSNQIKGCQTESLNRELVLDSMSDYSFFADSLIISVLVASNCCPDENRFSVSTAFLKDSIVVSIADTAESLCDCVCNYKIQIVSDNITQDSLYFSCTYSDSVHSEGMLLRN